MSLVKGAVGAVSPSTMVVLYVAMANG